MQFNITNLAWEKMQGLIPAVVQDAKTHAVLMLAYMNQEALEKTIATKRVTFFSRSKKQLWTKGDTSGNQLHLVEIIPDCDQDALLILANPTGPICHLETTTCFGEMQQDTSQILNELEQIILDRQQHFAENSYTSELFNAGITRIAQKVGEESIEVVLAAVTESDAAFCGEAADLLFHLLVLLRAKNISLNDVMAVLQQRRN